MNPAPFGRQIEDAKAFGISGDSQLDVIEPSCIEALIGPVGGLGEFVWGRAQEDRASVLQVEVGRGDYHPDCLLVATGHFKTDELTSL